MKNRKGAAAMGLLLLLIVSLCGCGKAEKESTEDTPALSTAAPPASAEESGLTETSETVAPQEPSAVSLFSFKAGADAEQTVSSNSTQVWTVTTDTKPSYTVLSFYNNYDKGEGGLPGEERIWFSLDHMTPFRTADAAALRLTVKNLFVRRDSDINMNTLDRLQLLYSTDNGASFSEPIPVKTHYRLDEAVLLSDGRMAAAYILWTEDLLQLLPRDVTVTDLRVRPFGDYAQHFGGMRLAEVELTAYSGEMPALIGDDAPAAETVQLEEETLRDIVVDHIHQVARATCYLPEEIKTTNYSGDSNVGKAMSIVYPAGITLRGPIYSRESKTSAAEWFEAIRDGTYRAGTTDKTVAGMDCERIVHDAIHTVSTVQSASTAAYVDPGFVFLGRLNNDGQSLNAPEILAPFSREDRCEALALLKKGDLVISFAGNAAKYNNAVSTHVRLVVAEPTVVRNADGRIDPDKSYVSCTEAGGAVYHYFRDGADGSIVRQRSRSAYQNDSRYTYLYSGSVRTEEPYSFSDLMKSSYVPMSLKVYETGKVELPWFQVRAGSGEAQTEGVRLLIGSNYAIPYLDVRVTDAQGKTVYEGRIDQKTSFVTPVVDTDVAKWLQTAPAGSYHYTLTTRCGPVLTVGGEVPLQTVYETELVK